MYGSRSPASIAGSIAGSWEKVIDEESIANNRPDSRLSRLSGLSGPEDSSTYNTVRIQENVPFTSQHSHVVVNGNPATDGTELSSPPMFTTLPPPGVLVSTIQAPFVMLDSSSLQNSNPPSFPNLSSLPSRNALSSFNLGQHMPPTSHYQTARCEEKQLPLLPEHQNQEPSQFKNDQKRAAAVEQQPSASQPKQRFGNSDQAFTPTIHSGVPGIHHSLPAHHGATPLQNAFYLPQFSSQWIPASQAHWYPGPHVQAFHAQREPQQNMQHDSSAFQPLYPAYGNQSFAYPIHNPHTIYTLPGAGYPLISGSSGTSAQSKGQVASTEHS